MPKLEYLPFRADRPAQLHLYMVLVGLDFRTIWDPRWREVFAALADSGPAPASYAQTLESWAASASNRQRN